MDNNDITISKIPRKTYSRELLRSLQNSELSILWPKTLDKTCINSHNQWDPVKSFENTKTTDNKKNIFPENKPGYRNNDKSKDDISLRPERRRWNDGCQVSNNKRNSDDIHSTSYRKSYQNTVPSCGGGDYDRNRFNRNVTRNNKSKESENSRENKINTTNPPKLEKSSRNNSNLEERKDEKEDQLKTNLKNGNNSRFNKNMEPEWFVDGPENCEETIELRGISVNDNEMMNFKACSSKSEETAKQGENLLLNLPLENSVLVENCVSPKREGSRFQDIFLKEKKINHLNESKDVENILKAVLSDNVSKRDAERLNNVSKPLPNGVLTLEEIEKNMTSGPIQLDHPMTSKPTTIDTLNSFEPRLNSLLSSDMSSPSKDNSKVVNWLSGLNLHISKDQPEIDKKIQKYNDTNSFVINQQMSISANYPKFTPTLQPPPGLPLVLNNNSLQQQQQQQTQQLLQHQQQIHQNKLLLMKMQMSAQPNMINHGIQQRNLLPYMFQHQQLQQHHHPPNDFDNFLGGGNDNYKPSNGPAPNEQLHIDQTMLSNYLMKHKVSPPISQLMGQDGRNQHQHHPMLSMNGPPGLTSMSTMLEHKNMIMQPRPIVKTSSPQMYDIGAMSSSEFHNKPPNFHNTNNNINNTNSNNFQYHRSMSANNPIELHKIFNRCPSLIETGSSPHSHMVQEPSPLDLYSSMRSRDMFQKQSMLFGNNSYPAVARQSFIPSAHEISLQSPSGGTASNKILANLFNVGASSTLPPLPQQAKYADQIETENI